MADTPGKFFSAALEAAQRIKQKRGTGQQLKSMLKTYGAKQKELDYLNMDDRFRDAESYHTQDLIEYIDANQVKPEEVVKQGQNKGAEELRHDAVVAILRGDEEKYKELTGGFGFDDEIRRMQHEYNTAYSRSAEDSVRDEIMSYIPVDEDAGGGTRWSQYVTGEPSDQYTEHLVTLPERTPFEINPARKKYDAEGNWIPAPQYDYQSPHWEEPNVLAHMRYDYDPDALRLEEIQSDWLQQAREKGFKFTPEEQAAHTRRQQDASADYLNFRDALSRKYGFSPSEFRVPGALLQDVHDRASPEELAKYTKLSNEWTDLRNATSNQRFALPRAPLANVNDWTSMMLRRAMLEAAEQDKPKIRWTSGALQDKRYSPQAGRAKFYDEIIPNLATKIARPYAKVVPGYIDEGIPPEAWITMNQPDNMWQLELPPKLIEELQKRGKVPFFKDGGEV